MNRQTPLLHNIFAQTLVNNKPKNLQGKNRLKSPQYNNKAFNPLRQTIIEMFSFRQKSLLLKILGYNFNLEFQSTQKTS